MVSLGSVRPHCRGGFRRCYYYSDYRGGTLVCGSHGWYLGVAPLVSRGYGGYGNGASYYCSLYCYVDDGGSPVEAQILNCSW